tara:strand:- start:854 stop:1378 length:525 start_codon:yes stop_codon:yes gene_type:complete
MRPKNDFNIEFSGLKLGHHNFDFDISETFFNDYNYCDFSHADINIDVALIKKTTIMEFNIVVRGNVRIKCDLTNEPYDQPIENNIDLVVKFGNEFNNEDDEILIIPHGEHKINLAQYIYELIILSVPAKRIHPGVIDGSLKSEILNILEDLKPKENKKTVDPRWEKLKEIITNK